METEQAATMLAPDSPTWWRTADSASLPTYRELPCEDKSVPVTEYETTQRQLLNDSARPFLSRMFPGRPFAISGDHFIYFRRDRNPKKGAVAPDWYVFADISPLDDRGDYKDAIVLWQEKCSPTLVLEVVSEHQGGERSKVEGKGKFWIYERAVEAHWYLIWDWMRDRLEVWRRDPDSGRFEAASPNEAGRYPIPELGFEFGFHPGELQWEPSAPYVRTVTYLRLWDSATGRMIPVPAETVEKLEVERERLAADLDERTAELDRRTAERDRLAAKLRSLGIDPEAA